jgi:hypothetical protein
MTLLLWARGLLLGALLLVALALLWTTVTSRE